MLKTLFDLGASYLLVSESAVPHLKKVENTRKSFNTVAVEIHTNQKCKVIVKLREYNPTAEIKHKIHVTKSLGTYNMIIGQDFLH